MLAGVWGGLVGYALLWLASDVRAGQGAGRGALETASARARRDTGGRQRPLGQGRPRARGSSGRTAWDVSHIRNRRSPSSKSDGWAITVLHRPSSGNQASIGYQAYSGHNIKDESVPPDMTEAQPCAAVVLLTDEATQSDGW